ncbi:aminotransferase class IV [Streptomyces cellulosae]|uniref:Aminotransferase n=1 Tax=Streptomyces cellulosae TaxID=1968 RepID=A0ABW7Y4G1_STRCE
MAELNRKPTTLDDLQSLALMNYGHFTSMRLGDGTVRGLSLHLDRLVRDCRIVFGVELDGERTLNTSGRQPTA